MKKKLLSMLLGVMTAISVGGCGNYDLIDTTYRFDYANVTLQTGEVISGKVEQWGDYDTDQIQVKINGKIYLVHSSNIDLITE